MSAVKLPTALLPTARAILEDHGALIEARGEGFAALLPRELWSTLGVAEELLLVEPESGAAAVRDSTLLAGLARLAQGDGRLVAADLQAPLRTLPALTQQALEHFPVAGATTVRCEGPSSGHAVYLQLTWLAELGGERPERQLLRTLLAEEGGLEPPGLVPLLAGRELAWQPWSTPTAAPPTLPALLARSLDQATRRAGQLAAAHGGELAEWLGLIDHQAGRFAAALREETSTTIARRKLAPEEVERRQQRLEESEAALERLRQRLREACAVPVRLAWLGGQRLRLPVQRLRLIVRRGKLERSLGLVWNMVSQSWEPVICEGCGGPATSTTLCPGPAHLLCPACAEVVAVQGRAGCPVCAASRSGEPGAPAPDLPEPRT